MGTRRIAFESVLSTSSASSSTRIVTWLSSIPSSRMPVTSPTSSPASRTGTPLWMTAAFLAWKTAPRSVFRSNQRRPVPIARSPTSATASEPRTKTPTISRT